MQSTFGCDSVVTVDLTINDNVDSPLDFQLILDDFCLETYWHVEDSYDSIWYISNPFDCNPNGGGIDANDTINTSLYLPENECYTLTLGDYFGDGLSASNWGGTDGSWKLLDLSGNILTQGSGNFGSEIEIDFFVTSAIPSSINTNLYNRTSFIEAYPNPFNNYTTVKISGESNGPYSYTLNDISGRIVFQVNNQQTKSFSLKNNNYPSGIYWLIINSHPEIKPLKLIIKK